MRASAIVLFLCAAAAAQATQPTAFLRLARELRFPGGAVSAVAISRDGTRVASAGTNGAVQVQDIATRELVTAFDACEGSVAQLAFDNAGARLAVFGDDLSFWSLPDGRLLQRLGVTRSDGFQTRCHVDWSRDGRWFAFPGAGNRVTVLDARSLAPVAGQDYGDWLVHALAFSADGDRLFVGQREGSVTTWHWAKAGGVDRFEGAHCETGLGVLADGRLVRGRWTTGGFVLGETVVAAKYSVGQVAVTPAGDAFGLLRNGRHVAILDRHGRERYELQLPGDGIPCFALGPADRVVTSGPDGKVRVWDAGAQTVELDGPTAQPEDLAFSGDGTLLAARHGASVYVFDLRSGARHQLPDCAAIGTGKAAHEIVALQGERFVRLDARTGAVLAGQDLPRPEFGFSARSSGTVLLAPDGRRAVAAYSGHAWVLDLERATAVTVAERIFTLRGATWSNDGSAALALEVNRMCGNSPRSCDLWLVADQRPPSEMTIGPFGLALAVDWAPDGRSVLVAARTHVERRRPTDGEVVARTEGSVRWLRHLDQGRVLAHDGSVISLWRTQPLQQTAVLTLPAVAMAPNGTPKQGWDLATIFDFDAGTRHVHAATLSRDGRHAAFAGSRGVFVFDVLDR